MKDTKVKILADVGNALASSLDIEKALLKMLDMFSEHLGMKRGTITLVDPATGDLKIEVAQGLTKEEKNRGRYKIGEGITGRVVQTGEAMVINDIGSEPLFLNRTQARKDLKEKKYAFLCVPIKFGNKVIGAFSVDHLFRGENSYEEDMNFLAIVASMIGQTVKIRELAERDKQAVVSENIKLKEKLKERNSFKNIIYNSQIMESVLQSALQVAESQATVLLLGESGTGKELVASAIHYSSPRANNPFVKVACAALPENLLESELFGHERGAFTGAVERKLGRFEMADHGTIFLDEIGDLTPATQVKLLRVLQEREFERLGGTSSVKVDVRVICATHRNLEKMVEDGSFREDLFYRINVFPVNLPPLKDRREDIPLLANHFIQKYCRINKKHLEGINKGALEILLNYDWPGNVRQLENVIERAVIVCPKGLIVEKHLPTNLAKAQINSIPLNATLPEIIEAIEKQKIEDSLKIHKTQRKTAKALGLTERILGYKIKKYGIQS